MISKDPALGGGGWGSRTRALITDGRDTEQSALPLCDSGPSATQRVFLNNRGEV